MLENFFRGKSGKSLICPKFKMTQKLLHLTFCSIIYITLQWYNLSKDDNIYLFIAFSISLTGELSKQEIYVFGIPPFYLTLSAE